MLSSFVGCERRLINRYVQKLRINFTYISISPLATEKGRKHKKMLTLVCFYDFILCRFQGRVDRKASVWER